MAEENSGDSGSSNYSGAPVARTVASEAISRAKEDLNFLASLVLEDFRFLYPPMFLAIWQFMRSKVDLMREFPKLAIGIPRGFAKTTLMKLWIIYCILFTQKRFIEIVSSSQSHGINILKDVCEMLSCSNIQKLFGDWRLNMERDQQECKVFKWRGRRIILAAIGATGNIRGMNLGNARPDVILFEDYQTKEDSESDVLAKKQYERMLSTIMKGKAFDNCMFIFVANMYPTKGSILKKLKKNPDWTSFIVGGILADGTSLWEELQPLKQLMEEYVSDCNAGHPEVFFAEVLNDENAGTKLGIDITQLQSVDTEELLEPQGRMIMIDPALDGPTSDYNGVGCLGLYDGVPILEKVDLGRYSPLALIKRALTMAFEMNSRVIGVESVAYQASLLFWFDFVCSEMKITGFTFVPIPATRTSKNHNIKLAITSVADKSVGVGKDVWGHFMSELLIWDPTKAKNEDTTLDLVKFMPKCVELYKMQFCLPLLGSGLFNGAPVAVRTEAENSPI